MRYGLVVLEPERLELDLDDLRRLSVAANGLSGPRLKPTAKGILEAVRTIRRVQLDPTNAVAPSHLLVLWSRLGKFEPNRLERLRWKDRQVFELDAFLVPASVAVLSKSLPVSMTMSSGHSTELIVAPS